MIYEVKIVVTGTVKIRVEADNEKEAMDVAGDAFDDSEFDDPELNFDEFGEVTVVSGDPGRVYRERSK
jgi:hypothetical protein